MKQFVARQKDLSYHSRLKLFPAEIQSLDTAKTFKVNGHHLKPFYEGLQGANLEEIELEKTNDVALKPPDNE
ncbi:uncharacterized protein G2W53_001023 [Senna tora]|uniref:Uncharacterized protein n=1 Tax=Senna tora TaxID=362788 RepID=A0A834XF51_9FABA|nr:uncharacterized protein G2W53_001023 [Senna tora]